MSVHEHEIFCYIGIVYTNDGSYGESSLNVDILTEDFVIAR